MHIVIVTGTSGAGKSTALRALEDVGYYAVDNLPVPLVDKLVELVDGHSDVDKVAVVIDARSVSTGTESPLVAVPEILQTARDAGHQVDVIFLDASDDVLQRRFSETRRRHPLDAQGHLHEGIEIERRLLEPLNAVATVRIDSSEMSVHDIRRKVMHAYVGRRGEMAVTLLSFGFKHGLPNNADLVFDVRFLPNPHFDDALRPLTGRDQAVSRYVLRMDDTKEFVSKVQDLLLFLLPKYEEEGKAYVTVAIGCTGGRHRSVAIVEHLSAAFETNGRSVQVQHRDIEK